MKFLQRFKKEHSQDYKNIYTRSEHEWISLNPLIKESFDIFESYIHQSTSVNNIYKRVLFLKVNGSYACALDSGEKFILIFPELYQLLQGSLRMQGVAILAHELGHLVLDHQKKSTGNQRAQIEADLFANELGLGKYLLDFLKSRSNSKQINQRILALEKVIRRDI
jgi:hypothetical protein